ncbi:DUF6462 family protein [Eubacterium sp. AF34-35BH]|uniref:DUF6462 family protein n=1 Tax=Eubacterium sp. AF34-35BH TaxID=2293107 RepID=UPI001FAAD028|nr:DUF6462 family protein [Eubacterium sp. AF34-35BH]
MIINDKRCTSNDKKSENRKKFVRYGEGAQLYSMSQSTFEKLAKEAKAIYKYNKLVLVNTEKIDEYLELFHEF